MPGAAGDRVLAFDPVGAHFHDVIIGGDVRRSRARPRHGAKTRDPCGQIWVALAPSNRRSLPLRPIGKSSKLESVCYDIRGPVLEKARQMEEEGQNIIKLNIGNLAVVRARAARRDRAGHDPQPAAMRPATPTPRACSRRARRSSTTRSRSTSSGVTVDDVFLGNGASELITMSMNALLNNGDEVLIPAPDYPLWTASVALSGGTPVHYLCDEQSDWLPDIDDIARKITPRTRAIVVINPNNPTGALYPDALLQQIVELARKHEPDRLRRRDLRQDALRRQHPHRIASLADDVLFLTFNGLSKNYRSCGYRAGWMVVSGDQAPRARLHRGPRACSRRCACARTRRASSRSRPRSAATRASTTWSRPAAGSAASATSPTSC